MIVAKLRRESVRLSQIQDIAGCRVIVPTIIDQHEILEDRLDFVSAALALRNPDLPLGYRLNSRPSMGLTFKRSESEPTVERPPEIRFAFKRASEFVPVGPDTDVTVKEIDRVRKPQFGYRAVHLVVAYKNRFMEVQIRTQLQHAWAEVSEKAADNFHQGDEKLGAMRDRALGFIKSEAFDI